MGVVVSLVLTLAFFNSHVLACMMVSSHDFNEIGENIYADKLLNETEQNDLLHNLTEAKSRILAHYGDVVAKPKIIFISSQERAEKYGLISKEPGMSRTFPWQHYIVISPEGNNVDVIAHELVHAEIAKRLGYINYIFSLPVWFNEGAAMQVDYRKKKIWAYIQEGRELPAVSSFKSWRDFSTGDRALHYAAAKVEITSWLTSDTNRGLYNFLDEIENGEGFDKIYKIYSHKN